MERGWKPNVDISPNCPRCGCSNTKFCYYNNYSLTQPRYFCKGCRRYWTKGGSLRNVPVGGGCRKNRRGKSSRLSTATATADHGVQSLRHSHGNFLADHHHNHHHSTITTTCTSGSSLMPDGSHIDLALVYANFLNQKPETQADNNIGSEIQEFQSDHFDPSSLEFPSTGPDLSAENNCGYFGGIEKFCENQDGNINHFALPPLPGEEIVVATDHQEMLWATSSCDRMMNCHDHDHDHAMQFATQLPLVGPEAQDQNLISGSWSPFDLPITCEILSPPHHDKKI
ncbi:hypothetical protein FEM48_Zijuj12G0071100 [Ziziphus jujuba var. spinosa]|uniref:Dof zinc finger protein n=1 Tax=Ziziphus jujuba var. spinosa TaxID=714518 RepID=A0A978UBW3_ZIZJJ|nr:hypothetical protein FEM48_Zijuj12G0071100 [Ziziphus jujuba var. spinosa]